MNMIGHCIFKRTVAIVFGIGAMTTVQSFNPSASFPLGILTVFMALFFAFASATFWTSADMLAQKQEKPPA